MVTIDTQPGVIAAVGFILLDLLMVNVLDKVLGQLVNAYYLRQMRSGRAIHVRSVDVPGITNQLLGKFWQKGNAAVICIKLAIIAFVFMVNLSIQSRIVPRTRSVVLTGTFILDPSDKAWERDVVLTVSKRYLQSKECVVAEGDKLTYYGLAFNLTNGTYIESDVATSGWNTSGQYEVDDSSLICLTPETVTNPKQLAVVTGCTGAPPGQCSQFVRTERDGRIREAAIGRLSFMVQNVRVSFVEFYQEDVDRIWSEYKSPRLTCIDIPVTAVSGGSGVRNCILVARNGSHSIVEEYTHRSGNTFSLAFIAVGTGAVFLGDFPFERRQCGQVLVQHFLRTVGGWKNLSGFMVALASDYAGYKAEYQQKEWPARTVTEIPLWTVVVSAILMSIVLLSKLGTWFLLRKKNTHSINTIEGISSLMRKGHAEQPAILGLAMAGEDELAVTFLSDEKEAVALQEGHRIVF